MTKSNLISNDEKWQAVNDSDKSYDGLFFYGVRTTKIFCRPSCNSKKPNRLNVVFFNSKDSALADGFRPCKRCCPEYEIFEPDIDMIFKAQAIFNENYEKPINLIEIAKKMNISPSKMNRLFKNNTGITPIQYIIELRSKKAREFLENSEKSILEIAYLTGFKTLSNFYKCFKENTGATPNEYRNDRR